MTFLLEEERLHRKTRCLLGYIVVLRGEGRHQFRFQAAEYFDLVVLTNVNDSRAEIDTSDS